MKHALMMFDLASLRDRKARGNLLNGVKEGVEIAFMQTDCDIPSIVGVVLRFDESPLIWAASLVTLAKQMRAMMEEKKT